MGVPSFFKWLNFACPGLTVNVKSSWAFRELPPHAPRLTHLYLDLNGILHTCVQALINSSELGASRMTDNLDDLFQKITAYITAVLSVAMPSKLLVMTVDGVAPRAKMHQQRERRHRTAAERAKEDLRLRKTRLMWKRRDLKIPTVYEDMYNKISQNKRNGSAGEVLIDKNAITPGTKFMEQIGFLLRKFVQENLAQGKDGWDKIEVILSDSSVPGEGEHKILDLIRKQRVQEGYDPNHVHCIYGADADLIMLALSTHEPNFYIVREEHRRSNAPVVPLPAPGLGTSTSALEEAIGSIGDNLLQTQEIPAPEFTFIDIGQVRTFLFGFLSAPQSAPPEPRDPQHSGQFCPGDCVQETKPSSSKTKSSSKSPNKPKTSEPQAADPVPQNTHHLQNSHEYIIDEFVFLCFLCGNDFLPSLPSLETYRGGIDILMAMWKSLREKKQFRLVKNGEIDLAALQEFMKHYSQIEEKILKCLEEDAIKWAKWRGAGDKNNMQSYLLLTPEGYRQVADMNLEEVVKEEEEWREREQLDQSEEGDGAKKTDEEAPIGIGAIDSLETLDEMLAGINELKLYDPVKEQKLEKQFKSDMGILNAYEQEKEKYQLALTGAGSTDPGSPGSWEIRSDYKERYYRLRFDCDGEDFENMKKAIRDSYVEGLIWNFKYYNKGCPSWEWYYPYHFPPLPSELACLADFPGFVSPTTSTITVTLSANGEPVKHSFVPLSVNLNSNSKLSYEEYPSNKPPSTVEQLLSVLPPSSAWYLPEAYRNLMLDPFSPMSDMYACEYVLDRSSHSHFNHKLILPAIRVDVLCQEVSRIAKQHPDEPRLLHGTPMIARRIPTEATTPVACSPNSSSSSTTINPPSPSPVKFDLLGQYPEGVSHRGGHCIVCQKRKFDPPEHHSLFRSSHPKPQTPGNRSISKNPTPTAQHPHTSSEAPHPWTAPSALSISNNVQWCVYSPPPFPKHSPFMHELIPGVRLGNHREVAAKDALKAIEKSALSKSLLQIVESLFSGGTTPVEGNLPYSAAGSIGNNPALAAAVGNGNAGIATTTTTTSSGLILRGSGVAGGGLALNSSQLTGNGMGVTLQRAVVRVKSNFE